MRVFLKEEIITFRHVIIVTIVITLLNASKLIYNQL